MRERTAPAGSGIKPFIFLGAGIPVDSGAGSYLLLISVLLLVFLAAYLTTRFIATRGRGTGRGRFIQIKESLLIGREKSVLLLEAGNKYYLVGVTNQNMQLLGTLEKDELLDMQGDTENTAMLGLKGAIMHMLKTAQSVKDAPQQLKNTRAQYKEEQEEQEEQEEAPAVQEETADEAPQPENIRLRLLKKIPGKTQKQKPVSPVDSREAFSEEAMDMQESSFVQSLRDANEKVFTQEDEVIVELSQAAEEQPKPGRKRAGGGNKRAPVKSREDEIDRMMQSIEQRTQQLKHKYARDDDDAQK